MADDIKIVPIEEELNRLWEEQKEKNQIKACLFNLIVYAFDEGRRDYLKEMTRIIASRYPCRIIFIQGDSDQSKNYFHVEVSEEMVGEGDETIACDLIHVAVSQNQLARVPYIILPHLITDLPVNLFWGHDPTQECEILPLVKPYADRLIFDSECTACLQDFSSQILSETALDHLEAVDMNWILTNGWRQVIAETFYTQERIEDLKKSHTIHIKYHLQKTDFILHSDIQAIYLHGWLAAELNWDFISKEAVSESLLLRYHTGTNEVSIALIPEKRAVDLFPGTITSVQIATSSDHSYFLSRKANEASVLVHISSGEQCELPFRLPLPALRRGTTFLKAVLFEPKSEHYRQMLKKIQTIDWH